ncbi:MAG TPA: M56 family metallopeptidase [Gemmatimonadaceae bacterium]
MIAAWMGFTLVVGACFALAALAGERVAMAAARPVRTVWIAAIIAMLAWPALALAHASAFGSSAVAGALLAPITVGVHRATVFVAGSASAHLARALDVVLLASWSMLSLICLVHLARRMHALARQRRSWSTECVDGVCVRLSSDVGPAVVGLRPMEIVLPEWTRALDRPLRALVLCHEHEHRRARDPHVLFASTLLVALMPWNAALWWCVQRLRLAIEMDCDARVLRAHPRPERYGLLLLTIAQRHSAAATRFAPALSTPSSNLERRILAIRRSISHISRTRIALFGAAASAAIAIACSVPAPDTPTGPRASASRAATPNRFVAPAPSSAFVSFQIDKPAMPMSGNPAPQYPQALEQQHVDGNVLAQFVVDASGQVDMNTFKVLDATDPRFVDAIRNVLGSWKFTPAEVGGHEVKQLVQMPFAFEAS